MLEVRYSPNSGVDISGTIQELQNLQHTLTDQSHSLPLVIETNTACSPTPYVYVLQAIVCDYGETPLKVSVMGCNQLVIMGSLEGLQMLASFIELPPTPTVGWHSHFEYYEGNSWIDPASEPLVFSLK